MPLSPEALPVMLDLLETLRNVALSGQTPAPYLVGMPGGERPPLLVATSDPRAELLRLEHHHGPIRLAFHVQATAAGSGVWLMVNNLRGDRLRQFCQRARSGGWEALPYSWEPSSAALHCYLPGFAVTRRGLNPSLLEHLTA